MAEHEEITLTAQQREDIEADISLTKHTLDQLPRFERAGIDVKKQRKDLEAVLDRNEKLLVEFQ